LKRRTLLLLCTLLLGGCATGVFMGAGEPPVATEGQQADRRLAAAVTVTLRGQVPSRAVASRAVAVARGVSGVRAVQDALSVK
jgi:hypothetical protein